MPSIAARLRSGGSASPEPSSPETMRALIASAASRLTEVLLSVGNSRTTGGAPSVAGNDSVVVAGRGFLADPSLMTGPWSCSMLTFDQPLAAPEALFPSGRGDVQISLRVVRMGADDVEVEIDPQAGSIRERQLPGPGVELRRPRDELACPGLVERVEVLLDQEVRDTGGQLQAHGRCHRPGYRRSSQSSLHGPPPDVGPTSGHRGRATGGARRNVIRWPGHLSRFLEPTSCPWRARAPVLAAPNFPSKWLDHLVASR